MAASLPPMPPPRDLRSRARAIGARLARAYPGGARELCALEHRNPYELLVATILSAQCTDERVNKVTPELFARYPDARALAAARREDLEAIVRPTGFFRSKTESLLGCARALVERFEGEVPDGLDELTSLPGVGRKTANVVRSCGFGLPGLPVDTHVGRLARRLGLTTSSQPDRVEQDLAALFPPRDWGVLSLRLILHGRRTCTSRAPRCGECILADLCPKVGVTRPGG